ncbi:MAG: AraC family ligand binding domain-containing protein [Anaerolineae bacterium]|nr:AraC family ligand binding domain-containing protein [Anaerolineae bacterium]
MTEYAQIERPVEGIQIIDDVTAQFGVDTLEGRVGPLMQGASSRSQFFELPAGLYTYEHPHPTESIIYTVYGEWVLTTGGKRHVMKPRSLFWFGPGISAGYEVPFDAPAFILIFKSERGSDPEAMVDYLQNEMQPHLMQEHAAGQAFWMHELPPDHPAHVFARSLKQDPT